MLVQDDSDNAHVWLLERAVASLALGDPKAAIADLRRARDRFQDDQGTDYSGWFQSVLLDDRSLEYQGADFEVVLIRAIAALALGRQSYTSARSFRSSWPNSTSALKSSSRTMRSST